MRQHFRILKIALLFHTIQNKSEKNIHAMIMHTCKSTLNLVSWNHIYNCFNEILQIMFLQYIVVFLSRDVLNQFQLRGCNVYPHPPQFLYGFSLFQRMVFFAIGGAVAPPSPPLGYATGLYMYNIRCSPLDHCKIRFITLPLYVT
jgi:hypothetical protein